MPKLITDRQSAEFSIGLLTEGLAEHDNGCCTADEPCTWRVGMTKAREQYREAATANIAVDTTAPAEPEVRRSANGSGLANPLRSADNNNATDKQIAFIESLLNDRDDTKLSERHQFLVAQVRKGNAIPKRSASELIDKLKTAPRRQWVAKVTEQAAPQTDAPRPATARPARVPVTEDGLYLTPEGDIYKVQVAVHGSGRLYAKKLVKLDEPREMAKGVRTHEFVRDPGAINRLSATMKMTLEQMKKFGNDPESALYGTCCNCGMTLTDEVSIREGLGPVCGGRTKRRAR